MHRAFTRRMINLILKMAGYAVYNLSSVYDAYGATCADDVYGVYVDA